jgi:hypothetical protein
MVGWIFLRNIGNLGSEMRLEATSLLQLPENGEYCATEVGVEV